MAPDVDSFALLGAGGRVLQTAGRAFARPAVCKFYPRFARITIGAGICTAQWLPG